jgi:tight adherence protein B
VKPFIRIASLLLVACLLGGGVAFAQTTDSTAAPTETTEQAPVAEGSINIVQTDTSRYDDGGQVTMVVEFRGLPADVDPAQVVVTQNGEPLPRDQWSIAPGERSLVPSAVALVIDTSDSMAGEPLDAAKAAATAFVDQKGAGDFVSIVAFSDEAAVASQFTNSPETLKSVIDALEPNGGTAMFDGIIAAAELFDELQPDVRRSMIVLTDGADSNSEADRAAATEALTSRGLRAFGVALESDEFSPDDVGAIASDAGGFLLTTAEASELSALYGQIQSELNRLVVIRLSSGQTTPGEASFGVEYPGLDPVESVVAVPGFSTPTTVAPTTTTIYQLTAGSAVTPTYDAPLDPGALILLITLGIGGATALFVYILVGNEGDGTSRFGQRLAAYGRRGGLAEERRSFVERIPLLNRFTAAAEEQVRKRGLLNAVNATLEQGNLPLSAGEAIAAGIGLSAIAGLIVGLVTRNVTVGAVVAGFALILVFAIINFIGGREKRRFENQLPDTLTLLSTSLRAGYSLLQAVEAVAQEAPSPTGREFGRAIAEARLGRQVTEALDGITQRTQSKDFEWAVMAIEIQREVGGNLAEVLQTVADTMLARNRLRGEIKALTAEGRISALVLGLLPFAIGGFLFVSNPDYLQPLFTNLFGQIAIGAGLLLMGGGMLWLRKIVNIEV